MSKTRRAMLPDAGLVIHRMLKAFEDEAKLVEAHKKKIDALKGKVASVWPRWYRGIPVKLDTAKRDLASARTALKYVSKFHKPFDPAVLAALDDLYEIVNERRRAWRLENERFDDRSPGRQRGAPELPEAVLVYGGGAVNALIRMGYSQAEAAKRVADQINLSSVASAALPPRGERPGGKPYKFNGRSLLRALRKRHFLAPSSDGQNKP